MNYYLLHLANLLYLLSYSVRDILWLRMITIVAMVLLGAFYFATEQWAPVYWQAAFLGINLFHVVLLVHERRPIQLSEEERCLHQQALKPLTAHQVRRLASQGTWCDAQIGEILLRESTPNNGLRLLVTGEASVSVAGKEIAKLHGSQFFGEMSFLTGNVTTAAIVATTPVRYVEFSDNLLQELSRRDSEFATSLRAAIGTDLVRKLLSNRS
jgi:hypothetical protein